MTYKKLDSEFTKTGFRYKQVWRENDVAIFHKADISGSIPRDAGFEVVIVTQHNGYEIGGNTIEPSEVYPGSERWGILGWTYTNFLQAETRFNKVKNPENRAQNIEIDMVDTPPVFSSEPKSGNRRGRKPLEKPEIVIPEGEFSVKELAEANHVQYVIAYMFVKENVAKGLLKTTQEVRRAARGPMTQLFSKV